MTVLLLILVAVLFWYIVWQRDRISSLERKVEKVGAAYGRLYTRFMQSKVDPLTNQVLIPRRRTGWRPDEITAAGRREQFRLFAAHM